MIMKICILSAFEDSLKRDTGPSMRIYGLAKGLTCLGHEIHVIIPSRSDANSHIDGIAVHEVRGLYPSPILRILSGCLGVTKSSSIFFYDLVFIARALRTITECDVVQIEQQTAGGFLIPLVVLAIKKPLVLDCHDTFQALRVKHTNVMRRILETFVEKLAYRLASRILTVSKIDRRWLEYYGVKTSESNVIPNGVDTEAFRPPDRLSRVLDGHERDSRTVVFVGNMEYEPNLEAVKAIASKIEPIVRQRIQNVRFLIIGRTKSEMRFPNLIFAGVVDDVARFLNASEVAIAPLMSGSGTRLKILEYFSCGLPVVATRIGAEGLDVEDGVHILIANDMGEFASKVIGLLEEREFSLKIGNAGRKLVVSQYDWKRISLQLEAVYNRLLSGRHVTSSHDCAVPVPHLETD